MGIVLTRPFDDGYDFIPFIQLLLFHIFNFFFMRGFLRVFYMRELGDLPDLLLFSISMVQIWGKKMELLFLTIRKEARWGLLVDSLW